MELNENSTIKQLIESKKSLKALGKILSRNHSTVGKVFTSIGYSYDSKQKSWLREDNEKSDEIPFRQAIEELKGAQKSSPNRKTNTKLMDTKVVASTELMSTNDKLMKTAPDYELMETNVELMDTPLISPNAKLIETNVLNVLGMTSEEVQVLKQIVHERMNNESPDDIYTAISKLGGRNRKNKTFYISEDITNNVQEFCDDRGIKLSSFVEIAMIEAMMKYK